jgi:hypothetical protein
MNEEETRESAGALAVALTRLADTMPDDPYRLEAVHARVRRLRARRRARLAAVGVVASAVAVTSLVAVRSGRDRVATVAASEPTTASTSPGCHAALEAARQARTSPSVAEGRRGMKGYGAIVGTPSETSVTIHFDEPATDQPAEFTATFTDQTIFVDAGVEGPRPAMGPGDRVIFATTDPDSGYQLLLLEVRPLDQPAGDVSQEVIDAKKAEAARAAGTAEATEIKSTAEVVSVQAGSITLNVHDGPQAGQVIDAATGPDTQFVAGGTQCSGTDLVAGDAVGVVLKPGTDGNYVAAEVVLN